MYLVHEIFASVQGEGVRTGIPTVFIRLAGCNLECEWCDTTFARSKRYARSMSKEEIIEAVRVHGMDNICITGGEPFCHENLKELVESLLEVGFNVDLETNGSFDINDLLHACPGALISMDVKTPSSGMEGSFEMANIGHLRPSDQLKFIVSGREDLDFALSFISENKPVCNIIITPCDNNGARDIVEYLKGILSEAYVERDRELMGLYSRIRVLLQLHKVIWGNIRGV